MGEAGGGSLQAAYDTWFLNQSKGAGGGGRIWLSFIEGRAETGDIRDPARVPSCHKGCHGQP